MRREVARALKANRNTRQKDADRRVVLDRLIEVADSITSDLVVGERSEQPGKYVVGALTLINWRDRITSVLRLLETTHGNAADESRAIDRPDHDGDLRAHQARSIAAGEPSLQPGVVKSSDDPRKVAEVIAGPIPLNREQINAVLDFAANDRLWSTKETTEFNLYTFARLILKAQGPAA